MRSLRPHRRGPHSAQLPRHAVGCTGAPGAATEVCAAHEQAAEPHPSGAAPLSPAQFLGPATPTSLAQRQAERLEGTYFLKSRFLVNK